FRLALLAASLCALMAGGARAPEPKEKKSSPTPFFLYAPGHTRTRQEFNKASLNQEVFAAGRGMTPPPLSANAATLPSRIDPASPEPDVPFLAVSDRHILGTSRVYYNRRSLESDIDRYYSDASFTDWALDSGVGGFEVERVSVSFNHEDPMQCLAFRKQGAPR